MRPSALRARSVQLTLTAVTVAVHHTHSDGVYRCCDTIHRCSRKAVRSTPPSPSASLCSPACSPPATSAVRALLQPASDLQPVLESLTASPRRRVHSASCAVQSALQSVNPAPTKDVVVFEPILAPLADVFGCAAIVRAVPSTFLFVGFFIRRFDEPGPLIRRRAGRIDWHAHRWTLDPALLQVREG